MLSPFYYEARDLNDAWFALIYNLFNEDYARKYVIEKGSYVGQTRLEYFWANVRIKYPATRPFLSMPEGSPLAAPTDGETIEKYFANYIMDDKLEKNELYRYSSSIKPQVDKIIDMLSNSPNTNQACMSIGSPNSIKLSDPECVLEGEMVITNRGVLKCEDAKIDDLIYTHKGRFRRINKVYKRYYTGGVYSAKRSGGLKTYITEEHPILCLKADNCPYTSANMYCKSNCLKKNTYNKNQRVCPEVYKEYSEEWNTLNEKDNIFVSNIKSEGTINNVSCSVDIEMKKKKFRLFGYYLAEGSLVHPRPSTGKGWGIQFSINKNETKLEKDIIDIMALIYNKKHFNKETVKNCTKLIFYSKDLYTKFKNMFYDIPKNPKRGKGNGIYTCYYKTFPTNFLLMPRIVQKELIEGIFMGDGYKTKAGDKTFYITSKKLIVLCSAILQNLYDNFTGYYIRKNKNCSVIDGRKIESKKSGYVFSYRADGKVLTRSSVIVHNDFPFRKIDVSGLSYSGFVYNFEVEEDNSYLVNGWLPAHNCLRVLDWRAINNKLHVYVYFRSNDLYNAWPTNMGGIQLLKEFICEMTGLQDGEILYSSKGLHIYGFSEDLAKMRLMKDLKNKNENNT